MIMHGYENQVWRINVGFLCLKNKVFSNYFPLLEIIWSTQNQFGDYIITIDYFSNNLYNFKIIVN